MQKKLILQVKMDIILFVLNLLGLESSHLMTLRLPPRLWKSMMVKRWTASSLDCVMLRTGLEEMAAVMGSIVAEEEEEVGGV